MKERKNHLCLRSLLTNELHDVFVLQRMMQTNLLGAMLQEEAVNQSVDSKNVGDSNELTLALRPHTLALLNDFSKSL